MMNLRIASILILLLISGRTFSQEAGHLSGNFQVDAQYYRTDSLIGAPTVAQKMASNSFANFRYDQGRFSAGLRFESYLPALQGYDPGYDGVGVPYYFVNYRMDEVEVTLGSIYEQFGSGILLRSWEDKNLGVDNAIIGVRIRSELTRGLKVTGLIGKQRYFFEPGPGIVRGLDGEWDVNEMIAPLREMPLRVALGGSFVSKYQTDHDPIYILPENVASAAGRLRVGFRNFLLEGEYAYKINDPSLDNHFDYRPGQAYILNVTYAVSGLGIHLTAKRVDNMSFRSDRNESLNRLMINYIPAITKSHVYSLMNLYPYASQPSGEMGLQGEVTYTIRRGSKVGGRYGTLIGVNFSAVNNLPGPDGEKELFLRDLNLEVSRRFSKAWKVIGQYQHLTYNQNVLEGKGDIVRADIAVVDLSWRISERHALKAELQGLWTDDDKGSWMMGSLEYSISPRWFFSISDQYNYGNPDPVHRTHYILGSVGVVKNATRIQVGFGRQREGILCVGGICRQVPAMNGVSVLVSTSF